MALPAVPLPFRQRFSNLTTALLDASVYDISKVLADPSFWIMLASPSPEKVKGIPVGMLSAVTMEYVAAPKWIRPPPVRAVIAAWMTVAATAPLLRRLPLCKRNER